MEIYVYPSISRDIHGYLWIYVDIHGYPLMTPIMEQDELLNRRAFLCWGGERAYSRSTALGGKCLGTHISLTAVATEHMGTGHTLNERFSAHALLRLRRTLTRLGKQIKRHVSIKPFLIFVWPSILSAQWLAPPGKIYRRDMRPIYIG